MNTSVMVEAKARSVKTTKTDLIVLLADGREVKVPFAWFPRLFHATPVHRSSYRLIGNGIGIHWPALDEDLSVEGLLAVR